MEAPWPQIEEPLLISEEVKHKERILAAADASANDN